jgi:CubicO group peptidase (beta-lactamase class C family)
MAHPPGEHWAYNSSSLILVGEIIAREAGIPLHEFADKHLFEPLGIRHMQWNFSPRGRAWIGGGARMRPRDMAKIGQLMVSGGKWNGERILSEEWITESTSGHENMLNGVMYGYLWQTARVNIDAERIRAFWASGNGGQYIIVIPPLDTVAVFTGGNYDSPLANQPFDLLARFILPAVMQSGPLDEITLGKEDLDRLTGIYELDFERAVTSTITTDGDRLSLLSPDGETITLIPHSPLYFTGDSRYGRLSITFSRNDTGTVTGMTIGKPFVEFVFVKREQ